MLCLTPIVYLSLVVIVLIYTLVARNNGDGWDWFLGLLSIAVIAAPLLLTMSLVDVGSRWWN